MNTYEIASPEQISNASDVLKKLRLYEIVKESGDEQKTKLLEQLIQKSRLCLLEAVTDLFLVSKIRMDCTLVINSTNHLLIQRAVKYGFHILLYEKFQTASPEQISNASEVIWKLRLYKTAKDSAHEQEIMLLEYPMVKIVNMLQCRPDLHTQPIRNLLRGVEAGNEGAYKSLVRSDEFRKLKYEVEHAKTTNNRIGDDLRVKAKELILKWRVCLIENEIDFSLISANIMRCTCVISSTNHALINLALEDGFDILVYERFQTASPQQISNGSEVIRKLRLYKTAKESSDEHKIMLREYPMVKMVNMLRRRPDLHNQPILQLLPEVEAGNERAYKSLVRSDEFKKLRYELEYGQAKHNRISDDFHVEAKQLIRKWRVCLIEDEMDFFLISANNMMCTCLISSTNEPLIDLALKDGFDIQVYHKTG